MRWDDIDHSTGGWAADRGGNQTALRDWLARRLRQYRQGVRQRPPPGDVLALRRWRWTNQARWLRIEIGYDRLRVLVGGGSTPAER